MQLLVDTKIDSNADLSAVLRLVMATLDARGVSYVLETTDGIRIYGDAEPALPEVHKPTALIPVVVAPSLSTDPVAAFGGPAPLPAAAIEIDVPASFTSPTTAAAIPAVPAAPVVVPPSAATTNPPTIPSIPAAPPATVAGAPAAPTTGADPEDSAGYRWDKRIHAETQTKVKSDGTWKLKRGIDPALVAAVRAEQRAAEVPASVPAGTQPPAPPAPPAPVDAYPPLTGPLVIIPAQPSAPPAPPAPGGAPAGYRMDVEPKSFSELMAFKAGPAVQAGRMNSSDLLAIAKHFGVDSLQSLVTDPSQVPMIAKEIDRRLGLSA